MTEISDSHQNSPPTVLEAFRNTATALRQWSIERIRVVGLSKGCEKAPNKDNHNNNNNLQPSRTAGAPGNSDLTDPIRVLTELEFMQQFVFQSRPCVILDAIHDWPALQRWKEDRYLFDLDHHLPSESEPEDDADDDEEEEEREEGEEVGESSETKKTTEKPALKDLPVEAPSSHALPRPHGPKKVTVALTPNGRADAVCEVRYDPHAVRPPLPKTDEAKNENHCETNHPNDSLRTEQLFMVAAEVKVTLPELHALLARSVDAARPPRSDFFDFATPSPLPIIAYAQLQNDCLNREYAHLRKDVRETLLDFGGRVFGQPVEAANVWFGTPASVSSLHQDWVENLYAVVRGVKEFLLIPPWEGPWIPKPRLPSAGFVLDEEKSDPAKLQFVFARFPKKDGTQVPWYDFEITAEEVEGDDGGAVVAAALREAIRRNKPPSDPLHPGLRSSSPAEVGNLGTKGKEGGDEPNEEKEGVLRPLVARVYPGETLYLPALWLHRVGQHAGAEDIAARARLRKQKANSNATINPNETSDKLEEPPLPLIAAVNYWFDISYTNPAVVLLREFGLLL